MSPAAGGAAAAPTRPPAAIGALAPAPAPALAIAAPEPGRAAPPSRENRRDPSGQPEGADPGNAAARKTAWNVPVLHPSSAAAAPGGIMGGDASWPALAESARVGPASASSDSLKSLSDGSAPSASDLIVPSPLPHPIINPISTGANPTSTSPPPNATVEASSQQNSGTGQLNPVPHGAEDSGNRGGSSSGDASSGSRSTGNPSSSDGNNCSGGDENRNIGIIGTGNGCNGDTNSTNADGDANSSNGSAGSNMNNAVHSGGSGGSSNGNESSRRALANNNWNSHGRGTGVSNNSGIGSGDGSGRNSGGGGNFWSNNARNGSGGGNGFGTRGGRNRHEHGRGGSFTPRNYPRLPPMSHHQQQQGMYQPGPFHRPPPPPPPAHFMVPHPYVSYAPFAYHGDVQAYPFYLTPVEQFQNMHLVRHPVQPLFVQQDQQTLQEDIREQIEFYFSFENLCHDTFLRRQMNDQGWVHIDVLARFNRMRRFTDLVDTDYILDAIRGSEKLEVQGNNVRKRNDWAVWLIR